MMDRKKFTENMLLYGAEIHQWPEEQRRAGLAALEASTEIQELYKEYELFEEVLRTREYEEPSQDLAERIIARSAKQEQQPIGLGSFIISLLNDLRFPRLAVSTLSIVILFILILGFAIGFLTPLDSSVMDSQEETSLQSFLYEEGDLI
jgi:hypothetical protein